VKISANGVTYVASIYLSVSVYLSVCLFVCLSACQSIKSNQINIRLIRWQNTTTVTDTKVVYINTMLFDGRRTKLTSG